MYVQMHPVAYENDNSSFSQSATQISMGYLVWSFWLLNEFLNVWNTRQKWCIWENIVKPSEADAVQGFPSSK